MSGAKYARLNFGSEALDHRVLQIRLDHPMAYDELEGWRINIVRDAGGSTDCPGAPIEQSWESRLVVSLPSARLVIAETASMSLKHDLINLSNFTEYLLRLLILGRLAKEA